MQRYRSERLILHDTFVRFKNAIKCIRVEISRKFDRRVYFRK